MPTRNHYRHGAKDEDEQAYESRPPIGPRQGKARADSNADTDPEVDRSHGSIGHPHPPAPIHPKSVRGWLSLRLTVEAPPVVAHSDRRAIELNVGFLEV
jgi:hypothetical protein